MFSPKALIANIQEYFPDLQDSITTGQMLVGRRSI